MITAVKQKFNEWSYQDQLTRQYGEEKAIRIMRLNGWTVKVKKKRNPNPTRQRNCLMCEETFIFKSGKQLYCLLNSQGQECSAINKRNKLEARRGKYRNA